jgi:hypothetical protein
MADWASTGCLVAGRSLGVWLWLIDDCSLVPQGLMMSEQKLSSKLEKLRASMGWSGPLLTCGDVQK